MPSGYTAKLYEGDQDFTEFLFGCARGIGYLISMRDEPWTAEIPDFFVPDPYYEERVARARGRIDEIQALDDVELMKSQERQREDRVKSLEKYANENRQRKERYVKMLDRAKAWEPPTAEHEGLQQLMVEQLEQSLQFDTDHRPPALPPLSPVAEYREQELALAHAEIEDAERELEREISRCEDRTAWVQALKSSVTA